MEYEQKLDEILKYLNKYSVYKSFNDIEQSLKDICPDAIELYDLMDKLKADANVDFNSTAGFKININGKILLENKGYTEKKRKENEIYESTLKNEGFAKINISLTVYVIVLAIIAIIVALLPLLFK